MHTPLYLIIITSVSEVIMFSPCVFVCLCLYHDVCPDDLPMKDWCHTNNILQVHCWGCLVVQVMFHALMTSSMTSQGHRVGQILKFNLYISVNVWAKASIKSWKYRWCKWLSFWYIQFPVSLPLKKFVASSKWRPLWKYWNIKNSLHLTSDIKTASQIMGKKSTFYDYDVTDDVTWWPKSRPSIFLYKWNNIFHDN